MAERTPEEEAAIRSAWDRIFQRIDAETPKVDPNWRCERCGRCREGRFDLCKNRPAGAAHG